MTIRESCQCGSVEFSLENDPMMHFVCHCSDCQKLHGNSFGYAYSLDDVSITGEVGTYSYEGGSGICCISSRVLTVAASCIRNPI